MICLLFIARVPTRCYSSRENIQGSLVVRNSFSEKSLKYRRLIKVTQLPGLNAYALREEQNGWSLASAPSFFCPPFPLPSFFSFSYSFPIPHSFSFSFFLFPFFLPLSVAFLSLFPPFILLFPSSLSLIVSCFTSLPRGLLWTHNNANG